MHSADRSGLQIVPEMFTARRSQVTEQRPAILRMVGLGGLPAQRLTAGLAASQPCWRGCSRSGICCICNAWLSLKYTGILRSDALTLERAQMPEAATTNGQGAEAEDGSWVLRFSKSL